MIYLRDLIPQVRKEYEAYIRKHRPDLVEAIENDENIVIADEFNIKDFYNDNA